MKGITDKEKAYVINILQQMNADERDSIFNFIAQLAPELHKMKEHDPDAFNKLLQETDAVHYTLIGYKFD